MLQQRRKLVIFAKAPIAGHAKSRMIPLLGREGAAKLHQEITDWLLSKVVDESIADSLYATELWVASDSTHPFFEQCKNRYDIALKLQKGEDLSERQFHAISSSLQESEHVVVIGSDVVSITQYDIQQAFDALEQGYELVIAPAEDGGYGLIGCAKIDAAVFDGIPWGSGQVYVGMVRNLNRLNYNWKQLSNVWDLDRPEDLMRLGLEPELPVEITKLLVSI